MRSGPIGAAFRSQPPPSITRGKGRRAALALATSATLALGAFGAAPAFAAPVETHTIADVQGTEATSPLVGTVVTVQGIVTGDYRTGGYEGITIQTAGSGGATDANPDASDAIFVYLKGRTTTLAIGDLVSVTGSVSEYFNQTQLNPAADADIELVTAAVGVPEATPLPDSVLGADRESLESMLVVPEGQYKLASSHQLFNYGALWLNAGDALNVKHTEQLRPGPDADAITAANRANRLLLDDGWSYQLNNKLHTGEQPYFTKDTVVRNGDTVVFPAQAYTLQWSFDDWRLQPTIPIDNNSPAEYKPTFESTNPRTDAPPAVGGDVSVASFNVYNYFTTLSSQNSQARGAKTAEEFAIQKSKIVAAINALHADVVALMEIENSVKLGGTIDSALADLVAGLNADAGSAVWSFVPTPAALNDAATTDFITSAIIYKSAAVTRVGDSMTQADETVWDIAREPVAQAFDFDGKIVTVVANHFKSKSPPKPAPGEPADGQGYFNAERTAQANAVLAFTETLATASGSDDMLLIGDFNSYAQEDPITVFTGAGWSDLVPSQAPGQYTYTFDGELGSLDHIIASPSLAEYITGTGVWNINSPEWSDRGFAYGATEAGTPFRSSDHDPIVVGVSSEIAPIDIDVVTINDFHGRIEADGANAAGAAVLAGAVQQVRAANPNTIFAAAGDLIGASTFTSFIQDDNPTIDALNAAGLDVSAAGNHEFDQGWEDLRDRVLPRADWEYISSNVFVTASGKTALAPSYVQELEGVKVGFIGAVTEELDSLVSPAGIADLEVRSIVDSVNAVADDLRDGDPANGEADVIILLVHEGATTVGVESITPTSALGRIVAGVDMDVNAIVSAHTHLAYNHVIEGRPVISAGQYGQNFGLMDIKVDAKTKELISITNEIKPLTDKGTPLYPAIPEVQTIVNEAKAKADVLGAVKVGDITADFNKARQSDNKTDNRGGESTLGNFVADIQLWATQDSGAQIALMNPGGLRTNLSYASGGAEDPDGNVTFKEAANVQPFANTLVTLDLTGAQLKSVLEEQWQPDGSSRPFLKLGVSEGFEYSYDPTAAVGARITAMSLNGEAIDPAGSYKVAANSFLAAGGDNFFTLAKGMNTADTGKVDLQAMVDWFDENGEATPDLVQRAVGAVLSAADTDGYSAGDVVSLDLSSLAFSAGETPAAETVTVSLDGSELASAAIDSSVVETFDEGGRASLELTIPDGVFGEQSLTVLVPETGTTIDIPITITGMPVTDAAITLGANKAVAGGKITVSGTKFDADAKVELELRSTPVSLGAVTAKADGTFSAEFVIPANTPLGVHNVVAILPNGAEVSAQLTVVAAGTPGVPGGPGSIANTGFEGGSFAAIALLVLLLGAGLTLVSTRRRARTE